MFTRAAAVDVDETQKCQLEALSRSGTTPQRTRAQVRGNLAGQSGAVEPRNFPANGLVSTDDPGHAGRFRPARHPGTARVAQAQALATSSDGRVGADDSGHDPEDQTG